MSDEEPATAGWNAIDSALKAVYGEQQPLHWGPILHASIGGPDPLDGISVYRVADPAHWHFVSYGMSELYAKDSDDPEVSGWGFEFTLRLRRGSDSEPPAWTLNFLNNLARYVFQTGNAFAVGHHMDLNGPIAVGVDTAIRAITFATDGELTPVATPHGRLAFLQVVGLTLDEYDAVQAWDAQKFLDLRRLRDPLLLTDLARSSWLADRAFAHQVREATLRDGSSQEIAFAARVEWQAGATAQLTLGANAVRSLVRLLPQRLPFGRSFVLAGGRQVIRFEPGEAAGWRAETEALVVSLRADDCARFCSALPIQRGSYRWEELPGLEVSVLPSEIKNADGKVVQVIG